MYKETKHFRIKGLTRILGSRPANPDVHSAYVAQKAATLAKSEEENAMLPEEIEKQGLTVFLRDRCGELSLCDYVIKGFLKEAIGAMKTELGILAVGSKVDNFVLIEPAYLHFKRDGKDIKTPSDIFERPLRAMTMQGPRTALAASESIDAGWELEFDLTLLDNNHSPKSKALTFEAIEKAFEYGWMKGLGQWRNAQNGRFELVEVCDVPDKPPKKQ